MRRITPVLLLALVIGPVHGQLGEKVRNTLVNVSTTLPDYDTTYVAAYRSNLVISVVSNWHDIDLSLERDEGGDLSYSTNSRGQYGFSLNYKWLSAEITFGVPALDGHDASYGNTSSRGFGLGYTGRRLWGRIFWDKTQGFYQNDPERWTAGWETGDPQILRPDLACNTYLLSLNYALSNNKRFSQNAALFQMERQKKSAGTMVTGLSAWYSHVTADTSILSPALVDTFLLDTGFKDVGRFIIGGTFGYAHTFAFWKKGFIHTALVPGVTYIHQTIETPNGTLSGDGGAFILEFKLGAGFNGDRWYSAITTAYYYSSAQISEKLSLSTNYGFVRFAVGIRLGDPGIKALGKVGL
ncbi:MAG: DUF4421 family protein [Flavobacteriales bacterium]|nr:DUF4421 family protein [Flavobacteriales bacterium]MBK7248160.1 DUF4421 family protein [Flavobacteriales bacterium]MBK9598518.1 DUF4421 family protein [Flavobacteriales bacterium]QQS73426.1 MAG: DUF4421 family protein [Flavobacteriales bacterium]HQV39873.1 DUF4421 family protein [Flavobacteriales bacterium]